MKKILLFLITLMTIFFIGEKVYAEDYSFYEAEYLDGIYMNKYNYSNNTIYYQKARVFRNRKNGELVYCIEPLTFFNESSIYSETTNPRNLTQRQIDRIEKIAYFGYRYKDHYDHSWYAVAQLMIWREANPTGGDYYFTDSLNGNRTNFYDNQINEINRLIEVYDSELAYDNTTITMVEGTSMEIPIGEALDHYSTNNTEISLENGIVKINALTEGEYNITLTRNNEIYFGRPFVIYTSPNSQTLMRGGDLDPKEVHLKINVIHTNVEIDKIDEDTKESIPQGDAKLDGSVFQLINENKEEIEQVEIINSKGILKDIPFGKYYLKEIIPGEGYELNTNFYEINITEDNPNISLEIPNKVIEKEITIRKTYGENNNKEPESNINFQVLKDEEIIQDNKTNEDGIVKFNLPYGTYKVKQLNTTEGYKLLDPFYIHIKDTDEETVELYDYKIKVPNTYKDKSIMEVLLNYLVMLLC